MIVRYDPDTDMLYIELLDKASVESEEASPGIVLDYDEDNHVVGLEIEDASKLIDLSRLEISALPLSNLIFNQGMSPGMNVGVANKKPHIKRLKRTGEPHA